MKKTILYPRRPLLFLAILLWILSITDTRAQESSENFWSAFQEKYKLKTSLGFQLWTTYTMKQEVYNADNDSYVRIDDRWNSQLRRSRLSISGQPYKKLSFKLTAALDLIGRDANAATQGGNNNGNFGQFALWNMYVRWKPFLEHDLFNITAGFQPAQIGRESITGALNSTSFEKSWSQNYLRRSIVGTGPGRAMGVNVGGQKNFSKNLSFSYDVGAFSPQAFSSQNNSQGVNASPLFVGRISISIGDPESKAYTTSYRINYFGERRGMTLAVAGSHHGKTDIFDKNEAVGFDWLINFDMLNLDGEWTYLSRSKNIENRDVKSKSNTGYVRLGYNISLPKGQFLEPVIMYVKFNGPMDRNGQKDALLLKSFAGSDQILDIGVNYHLNPKLKVSITYTVNQGDLGDSDAGATFNNYFRNSNKEAIRRGNLLGLALVGIF
jgi:hypothetical protein